MEGTGYVNVCHFDAVNIQCRIPANWVIVPACEALGQNVHFNVYSQIFCIHEQNIWWPVKIKSCIYVLSLVTDAHVFDLETTSALGHFRVQS